MAKIVDLWRRRRWRPPPSEALTSDHRRPVAVVTGASEGIGRAFAFELARHGHDLLLIARHAGPLEATAAEVVRATGRQVDTFAVDLTSPDATKQVMEELKARHCQVNILVNNAGVGLAGKFQKHEAVGLATLADLNVRALTLLTHAVLPGMLDRGRGGVINVASLGGHIPGPNQAAYYASKAYVISLTEALAWEARGRGVQITAVMPGPVNTQFHADMGAERSYYLKFMGVVSPERVARAGYRGYRLGLTLVYPRLIDRVLALCLRLSPHFIAVPIVSWLLRKRNGA